MARLLALGGAATAMLLLILPACASKEPSADEARVCTAVQLLVDELAAGNSQQALATLSQLEQAVGSTSNEQIATAGARFFADLVTDIDYRQLTIEETAQLGQQYQEALADSLDAVVAECDRVGSTIERLPA